MLFSHRNTSQVPLILSLCTLQYLSVVPVKKVYVSFKRIVVPYSSSHLYFSHKHYLPYSISHKNTMYLTVPLTKTMYLSLCVSNLQNHFYVFTVVEYINTVLKIFSTFLMKRTSPLHRKPNVNIVLGVLWPHLSLSLKFWHERGSRHLNSQPFGHELSTVPPDHHRIEWKSCLILGTFAQIVFFVYRSIVHFLSLLRRHRYEQCDQI